MTTNMTEATPGEWTDGWYRWTDKAYTQHETGIGYFDAAKIAMIQQYRSNNLYSLEPVVILTVAEHDALRATVQRLTTELAEAREWEPLNIVDDDMMATDIQGRDIESVKVLTTVEGGRRVSMRFADSDKPFMSWELLPHICLQRLREGGGDAGE